MKQRGNSDASYYYCVSLIEAQQIGEFLINSSSDWITRIDPEDILEQLYDY